MNESNCCPLQPTIRDPVPNSGVRPNSNGFLDWLSWIVRSELADFLTCFHVWIVSSLPNFCEVSFEPVWIFFSLVWTLNYWLRAIFRSFFWFSLFRFVLGYRGPISDCLLCVCPTARCVWLIFFFFLHQKTTSSFLHFTQARWIEWKFRPSHHLLINFRAFFDVFLFFFASDFDHRFFWKWTDFRSYVEFVAAFTLAASVLTYALIDSVVYVEVLGFTALLTEALLGAPQFYDNYVSKSTYGMRYLDRSFVCCPLTLPLGPWSQNSLHQWQSARKGFRNTCFQSTVPGSFHAPSPWSSYGGAVFEEATVKFCFSTLNLAQYCLVNMF